MESFIVFNQITWKFFLTFEKTSEIFKYDPSKVQNSFGRLSIY